MENASVMKEVKEEREKEEKEVDGDGDKKDAVEDATNGPVAT